MRTSWKPCTVGGILVLSPHFNTRVSGLRCPIPQVGKLNLRKVKKLTQNIFWVLSPWIFYFSHIKILFHCFFWFPSSSWLDFLSLKRDLSVPIRTQPFGLSVPSWDFSQVWFNLKKLWRRNRFISHGWSGDKLHSTVGVGAVLDPNSCDASGTICCQDWDLEVWDQPWGWCPRGVCLRDSPAFRTIFLPVLPVLLKNLGRTRIVQGFVEIVTVFEVPCGSFGFSVKPGIFFHWPFLS